METRQNASKKARAVWALCWLAACAGSWMFAVRQGKWPQPLSFLFAYLAIGGPFVAVGIWFGRMGLGIVAGLVALFLFLHFVLPMLH